MQDTIERARIGRCPYPYVYGGQMPAVAPIPPETSVELEFVRRQCIRPQADYDADLLSCWDEYRRDMERVGGHAEDHAATRRVIGLMVWVWVRFREPMRRGIPFDPAKLMAAYRASARRPDDDGASEVAA